MPATASLKKSFYSAEESLSLAQLDEEKISQIARDLDVAESEKEHYLTGWMGQNSVVLVRNYQDKRGTANGLVMSRGNRYKLTIQAITFRIPKILLWVTFRRTPRTMTVVAYNKLGEQASGLQQFMHVQDPELKERLENDWRELNDYLGMACCRWTITVQCGDSCMKRSHRRRCGCWQIHRGLAAKNCKMMAIWKVFG